MEKLEVVLENGRGEVQLFLDNQKAGKMDIGLSGDKLTVYHTEVDPLFEGKGFGRLLLQRMVVYARENGLKVIPLCPYVHAQFKRRPDEYQDIWFQNT